MLNPEFSNEWAEALEGGNDALLKHLAESEYPGTTLFQLTHYFMRQNLRMQRMRDPTKLEDSDRALARALAVRAQVRSFYDWNERKYFDLQALRELRQKSAVVPFLGAGVSIAAGGPSWPRLVEGLLLTGLDSKYQEHVPMPTRGGGWYFMQSSGAILFEGAARACANEQLNHIRDGSTDTDILMEGAQLCHDLFKEHFFSRITPLLYINCDTPGPIHKILAELALNSSAGTPGWGAIVTYNFDNLMGEAMDQLRRPYSIHMAKNNVLMYSASNNPVHTNIIHVHGYVPRELMRIEGIEYVFSTSQYEKLYGSGGSVLLNSLQKMLTKPDLVALYIGCSFTDTAMNRLLSGLISFRAGSYHYALLRLPEQWHAEAHIPEKKLAIEETRFLKMGIQPIWFRDFEEIPALIEILR